MRAALLTEPKPATDRPLTIVELPGPDFGPDALDRLSTGWVSGAAVLVM